MSGVPEESLLYLTVARQEEPVMPPGNEVLPDDAVKLIQDWIKGGLAESAESPGSADILTTENHPETAPKSAIAKGAPHPRAFEKSGPSDVSNQTKPEQPSDAQPPGGPVFVGKRPSAVNAVALSEPKDLIAIAGQLQVLLFSPTTQQLVRVLPFPEGEPQVLRFTRNGEYLLAGGGVAAQSGSVVVWDVDAGHRVFTANDQYDAVLAADLSPDSRLIAFGGPERLVKLIDTGSGEVIRTLEKHTDWVLATAFSPEGHLIATADRTGNVFIWERLSGEPLHSLRGHTDAVRAIVWSDTDDECATASEDGTIRTWDMNTGEAKQTWKAHSGGVLSLNKTTNGKLISAGRDHSIKTWKWTGEQIDDEQEIETLPLAVAGDDRGRQVVACLNGDMLLIAASAGAETRLTVPQELSTTDVSLLPTLQDLPHSTRQLASPSADHPSLTTHAPDGLDTPGAAIATNLRQAEQDHEKTSAVLQELESTLARLSMDCKKLRSEMETEIATRRLVASELNRLSQAEMTLGRERVDESEMFDAKLASMVEGLASVAKTCRELGEHDNLHRVGSSNGPSTNSPVGKELVDIELLTRMALNKAKAVRQANTEARDQQSARAGLVSILEDWRKAQATVHKRLHQLGTPIEAARAMIEAMRPEDESQN